MASLHLDNRTGHYFVRFRYGGQPYKRSLRTRSRKEARGVLARVEETIRLLGRGRLEMPPAADPGAFILSDGVITDKPDHEPRPRIRTLRDLFRVYTELLPQGTKEESTLYAEKIHVRHLLRLLKPSQPLRTLTTHELQTYIAVRAGESYRGQPISPATIKKEITTLRTVWNWAANQDLLDCRPPTRSLQFPKPDQKPPFQTWEQIEQTIKRGGLTQDKLDELWSCLFLNADETEQVLNHARTAASQPFVYPMFVFVAHTGARRSELLRSRIDDFDFGTQTVRIREKKKSRQKAMTYRHVPMTEQLSEAMSRWFGEHPGGQFTLAQPLRTVRGKTRDGFVPLTPSEARDHFRRTLRGVKWSNIRGFHVFRHSFASNLAAAGVDQRIIDEWMGHQTEEMRRRYRHLFPAQQRAALDSVFRRNGK